jgi:hypothetical protein
MGRNLSIISLPGTPRALSFARHFRADFSYTLTLHFVGLYDVGVFMRALPVVPLLLSLSCLALTTGCTSRSDTANNPEPVPAPVPAREPVASSISTVASSNGQTLVEIPLTSPGLEVGAFMRVYDVNNAHTLKGMVQIQEIMAGKRAVGRQITLADRQNPIVPGDTVKEVLDLAQLADPKTIEQAAQKAANKQQHDASVEQANHVVLREQYQKELAKAQARYDAQVEELRKQYDGQFKASDQVNELVMLKREQELRADLLAVKTTMSEQVASEVKKISDSYEQKLHVTQAENANLSQQIEALLVQQHNQNKRIEELVSENALKSEQQRQQLSAEIEARELLAAQIHALEARLSGQNASTVAVLSADPKHGESVLDRLSRLADKLSEKERENAQLDAALMSTKQALTKVTESNNQLTGELTSLKESLAQVTMTADELQHVKTKLLTTEQQRDELQLARLQAERQLFDLAARVLRLAGSSPETVALQARLRDVLGPENNSEKSTEHSK